MNADKTMLDKLYLVLLLLAEDHKKFRIKGRKIFFW